MRTILRKVDPLIDVFRMGGGLIALLMALAVPLFFPQAALGRMFISNGEGHGSGSGGLEGDPLDSNDSGGGSGGDIVHERRELPAGWGLAPLTGTSEIARYRIEAVVEDGQVRFVVIIQPVHNLVPEAMYVR